MNVTFTSPEFESLHDNLFKAKGIIECLSSLAATDYGYGTLYFTTMAVMELLGSEIKNLEERDNTLIREDVA